MTTQTKPAKLSPRQADVLQRIGAGERVTRIGMGDALYLADRVGYTICTQQVKGLTRRGLVIDNDLTPAGRAWLAADAAVRAEAERMATLERHD